MWINAVSWPNAQMVIRVLILFSINTNRIFIEENNINVASGNLKLY